MIEESRLEALGIIYMRYDMSKGEWAQWVKVYNEHIDKIMEGEINARMVRH